MLALLILSATACGENETSDPDLNVVVTDTTAATKPTQPTTLPEISSATTSSATLRTALPEVPSTTAPATDEQTTVPSSVEPTEPPTVVLPGYEDVAVRTVCVAVHAEYPDAAPTSPPALDAIVGDALTLIGLTAVPPDGTCDAELAFTLRGRPLSKEYGTDAGWVTQYSGAEYTGSAQFSVEGRQPVIIDVQGRLDPPFTIFQEYPEPSDAPFGIEPLIVPLLTTFSQVWGPQTALGTLPMWPFNMTTGVADWVAGAAPDLVDGLLEFRLEPDDQVSHTAYLALGEIVAQKAVSEAEQSKIVRTMIADMDSSDHPAGDALRRIANPPTSTEMAGFSEDDDGVLQPWDAEAWTAWADVQGY
jgi:hypothetical protein